MKMGVREYARHRGTSHTAVQRAIKAGRIKVGKDGRIDSVKADRDWEANTLQSQTPGKRINDPPIPEPQRNIGPHVIPMPDNNQPRRQAQSGSAEQDQKGIPNYQTSRAIREAYNAKIARIDFEQRMGKLVDRADVINAAFENARKIRDRINAVPSRLGASIAALAPGTNIGAVERLLAQEFSKILDELSQYLAKTK
ncbi:MAG: hypothetical protein HQL74_07515 [Magnetococcales bacterium]|nr:hypothetical protein [Magnetococcales bacterium]